MDWNVPIGCCEVLVMPGDILVGDADGVACIPRHVADEVARTGAELDELETFVVERIRGGAPVPGTYPPDEKTRGGVRDLAKSAQMSKNEQTSSSGEHRKALSKIPYRAEHSGHSATVHHVLSDSYFALVTRQTRSSTASP